MTTLALVDYDAMLLHWQARCGDERRARLPLPLKDDRGARLDADDGAGEPAGAGDSPDAVVVLAVSATACHVHHLTFRYLRRFATRLVATLSPGHAVPANKVACEIALHLTMPDVAAQALWRLLLNAGSEAAAIAFDELWLFSPDDRLAAAVHRALNPVDPHLGWPLRHDQPHLKRWTCPSRQRRLRSRPVPPMLSPGWLRHDAIDLPAGAELHEIACVLEHARGAIRPGLLSQIGITKATTRGVGRVAWLPGCPPLTVVSPEDGVVLFHVPPAGLLPLPEDVAPPSGTTVRAKLDAASVGSGAVALVYGPGATIARSRLPRHVLEDLSAGSVSRHGLFELALRPREIDDTRMLDKALPGRGLGDIVRVRLVTDGSSGWAEIPLFEGASHEAWWIGRSGSPVSWMALPVAFPVTQLPRRATAITVRAQLCAIPGGNGLGMRSILARNGHVEVSGAIAERTIGAVRVGSERGALLATEQPLGPRSMVSCTAVQDVELHELQARTGLSHAQCEDLMRHPLLVPS